MKCNSLFTRRTRRYLLCACLGLASADSGLTHSLARQLHARNAAGPTLSLIPSAIAAETPGDKVAPASLQLRIGLLVPLTGSASEQGKWGLQGAELAKERLKEQGIEVELYTEDTQADPKLALSSFNSLRMRKDLDAVITYGSGVGLALSPVCNQANIVQMGIATATSNYRSPDDFTFRNFPSAEHEAEFMAKQVVESLGVKKLNAVYLNNEYGESTTTAFKKNFEKLGGVVVQEQTLEPGATDFRSVIARLKAQPAEGIYLASYPTEGAIFLRQAREQGLSATLIASVALIGAENFFELAGPGAEGISIASSIPIFDAVDNPESKEFVQRYRNKYGAIPSLQHIYAARAYDAVRVLARAKSQCKVEDAECLKNALYSLEPLNGPSGELRFDRFGDISAQFSMIRIIQGKFEQVTK